MTDSAATAAPGLRRIVTPEGVALGVTLADRGSRAAAFLVDVLLIVAGVVGLVLAGWLLTAAISGWGLAAAMLGFFVLRNFYFSFFELRGRGVTPGKRLPCCAISISPSSSCAAAGSRPASGCSGSG